MRPGVWYFDKRKYEWKLTANSYSNSWAESTAFVNWIRAEKDIVSYEVTLAKGASREAIAGVANLVQIGDVIGFINCDLPNGEQVDANTVHHLAVITDIRDGQIFYSGHSNSRFDSNLYLALHKKDAESIVIFHINPNAE